MRASLSHVLLLTPQNPFYALQVAETAFTAQDIQRWPSTWPNMTTTTSSPGPRRMMVRCRVGQSSLLPQHNAFHKNAKPKLLPYFLALIIVLSSRRRAGHFLAVKDARARTLVAAAGAGAGRDQLGAPWPRRRIRSVPGMAKSEIVDPRL
jgi:hypothetical protein